MDRDKRNDATPSPPPQVWRWLGLAATLLLLLAVTAIGVISTGLLDPGPDGPPAATYRLAPAEVEAGGRSLTWTASAPEPGYVARLTAAHAGGEPDSAYGLALGEEKAALIAAVSPLGYAAIWQQDGAAQEMIFPWQPWPHVETGNATNEIQVAIAGNQATVRINRELLWEGTIPEAGQRAGIYLESFGEAAVVDFQTIALYEAEFTRQ
jgi:hypothetical protein